MDIKRTLTINLSRSPSISGYGGFDEWQLEDCTSEQIDEVVQAIDKLVNKMCKRGLQGGFTGVE